MSQQLSQPLSLQLVAVAKYFTPQLQAELYDVFKMCHYRVVMSVEAAELVYKY